MNTIMEKEISKPSVTKRALALFIALTYLSCLAPAVVYAEAGNSAAPQPSVLPSHSCFSPACVKNWNLRGCPLP